MNLINIDRDLINELKLNGKYIEAKKLIDAFIKNKKENTEQLKKEIRNNYSKAIANIRKHHKICLSCDTIVTDSIYCDKCKAKYRKMRCDYEKPINNK